MVEYVHQSAAQRGTPAQPPAAPPQQTANADAPMPPRTAPAARLRPNQPRQTDADRPTPPPGAHLPASPSPPALQTAAADIHLPPPPAQPQPAEAHRPTPPSATHLPAPAPQSAVADVPLPPDPAPPQPPDDEVPLPQTATPAGNPGTAAADRDALTVTGDDVASAGPDAAYRNMPPHYPPGAVRQHIEGSVQAAVSIAPDGSPTAIDIVISSGSALLDDAVRDAVLKWHFKPALRDGEPVPSVYKLQMNFRTQAAE